MMTTMMSVALIFAVCLPVIIRFHGWGKPSLAGGEISGRVVDVIDGNTLILAYFGQDYLVQIGGLASPADNPDGQDFAAWALVGLIYGRKLKVQINGQDRTGRITGQVTLDGRDIAQEMIISGFGRATRRSPVDLALVIAERQARQAGRGLWRAGTIASCPDQKFRGCRGKQCSAQT